MANKFSATRRIGAPLAFLTFIVLATVGCAPSDDAGATDAPEVETVQTSPEGTEAVDSITWNMGSGEPTTLNPPNVPTYSGMALVMNLCDALLTTDLDGTVQPGLTALEMPTPLKAIFTIQGDPTFWDGSPVTSDDIIFSFENASAPDSYLAGTFDVVESITATSPKQVVVEFNEPDTGFILTMASVGGAIMQRDFTEKAGEARGTPSGGLMCSGPFVLDEWNPGSDITLRKNDDYWDPARTPLVENVRLTFITDTAAMTQAFTTGEIDGGWEIPTAAANALSDVETGSVYFGESMSVWSLRVASPNSVLATSPELRQAFQHMIDRDTIASVIFHGAARPWAASVSPNSWAVDQRERALEPYQALADGRAYDPELAASLVEEAGATGERLEVIVQSGDETSTQLGQLIQEQAKIAGLELTLRSLPTLEYTQAMFDPEVREGSDLLLAVNGDIIQEPNAAMRYFYLPGGLYNWDGFADDEVTSLIEAARITPDATERTEMTMRIQAIAEEAGGTVSIVNPYQVNFVNDRIGGVVTNWTYTNLASLALIGGR